jgi:ankyrin repeat protein
VTITCSACNTTIEQVAEPTPSEPVVQLPCQTCGANIVVFRDSLGIADKTVSGEKEDAVSRKAAHVARPSGAAAFVFLCVFNYLFFIGGTAVLASLGFHHSEPQKIAESFIRQSEEIRAVVGDGLHGFAFPIGVDQVPDGVVKLHFRYRVMGSAGSTWVDVQLRNANVGWVLISAYYEDQTGTERSLLQEELSVDSPGWTVLHYAAAEGKVERVKRLLDQGWPVDVRTPIGRTPLYEAARMGRLETVKALLDKGADINAREKLVSFTPLHVAAEKKKADVLKYLLEKGADVNAKNEHDQTALHQAAMQRWHNDSVVAAFLVDHGAQLEARDNKGFTPLIIASDFHHLPFVAYLISKGANVNAKTAKNRTALYRAAKEGDSPLVKLLVENGADVNTQYEGLTALGVAEAEGNRQIADWLRQRGGSDKKLQAGEVYSRALDRYVQGDHVGAIAAYTEAIKLDPENWQYYYNRGVALFKDGKYDLAEADFKKAIEVEPNRIEPYINLDSMLARRGKWDEIISYWNHFIELNPNNGKAYLERGGAYHNKGDDESAFKDVAKSCKLGYADACKLYLSKKLGF